MRFSWLALLLAPLLVPLLFAGVFTVAYVLDQGTAENWLASFLILLGPSCVVSYGATIFLLLPSLHLLARWRRQRPLTWPGVILLGAALGLVAFLALSVVVWIANWPEAGQPAENFFVFMFAKDGWAWEPVTLAYPASGAATAALYWWLAGRRQPRPA